MKGAKMSLHSLSFEELKKLPFGEVIQQLLAQQKPLTVQVSNEQEVTVQLRPRLKPLPVLEGYLPDGWKDAIYE